MKYLRFQSQKVWRDVIFRANTVYGVGDRIHHKFVVLQGIAEDVADPELTRGVDVIPNPGEAAPLPVPPPPIVEEAPAAQEPELPLQSFKLVHKGGPWFDVVDQDGKVFNDIPTKKSEAEELLSTLKAHEFSKITEPTPSPPED